MANTNVQRKVEDWVRKEWMKKFYGKNFYRDRIKLSSGGVFEFDAVSQDGDIIASISTSSAITATGRRAAGPLHKIRADILFLIMTSIERKIIIFTEQNLYDVFMKEIKEGRVPRNIEFELVKIPNDMSMELKDARNIASKEVSPNYI